MDNRYNGNNRRDVSLGGQPGCTYPLNQQHTSAALPPHPQLHSFPLQQQQRRSPRQALDVYSRVSPADLEFIFRQFIQSQRQRNISEESIGVQTLVLQLVFQHYQLSLQQASAAVTAASAQQHQQHQHQHMLSSYSVAVPASGTSSSSGVSQATWMAASPVSGHRMNSRMHGVPFLTQPQRRRKDHSRERRFIVSRKVLRRISSYSPLPVSLTESVSHPVFRRLLQKNLWCTILDYLAVDVFPHLKSKCVLDGLFVSKLHSRARSTPVLTPACHRGAALDGVQSFRFNEGTETLKLLVDEAWRAGKILTFDTLWMKFLVPLFSPPRGKPGVATELRSHICIDAIHGKQSVVSYSSEGSSIMATLSDLKAQTARVIENSRKSRLSLDQDHREMLGLQGTQTFTFDEDEPLPITTQALASKNAELSSQVPSRQSQRLAELHLRAQRSGLGVVAEDFSGCTHVFLGEPSICPPAHWLTALQGATKKSSIAIHLTELQLPWLAYQIISGSINESRISELYCHFAEANFQQSSVLAASWKLVKASLISRENFTTFCFAPRVPKLGVHDKCQTEESMLRTIREQTSAFFNAEDLAGVCNDTLVTGVERILSLEVVKLQGVGPEAVASLLSPQYADQKSVCRPRLRQLYYTAETEGTAKAKSQTALELELHGGSLPALQVVWIDYTGLKTLQFTSAHLFVLSEVHLFADASYSVSGLAGIEKLPLLRLLHVERATVDDLSFLSECKMLTQLFLHHCRFTSAVEPQRCLYGVEQAPLEVLSLCYSTEVRHLANFVVCKTLRHLLLTRCYSVSNNTVAGLQALPLLETLALEYTRVDTISPFTVCPNLRVIILNGCKRILRQSIQGVESMPNVLELSLSSTNVTSIAQLAAGCHALRSLDLSHCVHLDSSGLQGVQALPMLEVLCLSHLLVTDLEFLSDCLSLRSLFLEGCASLGADGLRGLERIATLQRLVARECGGVREVGFLGLSRCLSVLSLEGCGGITWESIKGLSRCATLEYLSLGFCPGLTGATSEECGLFSSLEYVDLCGCSEVESITSLALPRSLHSLDLRGLVKLSSIAPLRDCVSLRTVALTNCPLLQDSDLAALESKGVTCLR